MKNLKPQIKRVNLKIDKYLHQRLMEERAKTDKSLNLLIVEAILKTYK